MFTGLVEQVGEIVEVRPLGQTTSGVRLRILSPLASELTPGDSLAVNGVCLTVIFGDAGTSITGSTNKFMRSPLPSPGDPPFFSDAARAAGAQGYRHNARGGRAATNVAFCDGHAATVPLPQLWSLYWKPKYVPPNPLPTMPKS